MGEVWLVAKSGENIQLFDTDFGGKAVDKLPKLLACGIEGPRLSEGMALSSVSSPPGMREADQLHAG